MLCYFYLFRAFFLVVDFNYLHIKEIINIFIVWPTNWFPAGDICERFLFRCCRLVVFCYYVSDTTHVRLQKASKLYSLSWVWPAGLVGWLAHRHLLNEFSNLLIAARVVNERIESSEQSSKSSSSCSSTSGCSISPVGYVWYHRILQCTPIAVDHACVSFFLILNSNKTTWFGSGVEYF